MELSPCVTDADLEAWRSVRIAVLPYERCDSVAEIRASATPERLLVLARVDGVVVGSGGAGPAESAGAGFVAPRVLPEHRRRGHGTTILEALLAHVSGLGLGTARAGVDDPGSLAFAEAHGFTEVDREVEQTRTLGHEPAPAAPPDGVEVVTLAERPELWTACFDTFGRQALADFAAYTPLEVSPGRWDTEWRGDAMFLALHEGEVIGCAGLHLDSDQPDRAEHALTAVRRDWRGRGLAVLLKRHTLHWAAARGLATVYTWTQAGNVAMLTLNERLGYTTTRTSASVSRALAQEEPARR